jgi:hypothetical protein
MSLVELVTHTGSTALKTPTRNQRIKAAAVPLALDKPLLSMPLVSDNALLPRDSSPLECVIGSC